MPQRSVGSAGRLSTDQAFGEPAWDLLPPLSSYRSHVWHALGHPDRSPYGAIHTTFGCPFSCEFCCISAPFGGRVYKRLSPGVVADEIEGLALYGVQHLKIVDEMFVLHPGHVLGVAAELAQRGLGEDLNLWAYARVDTCKPELLAPLRAAGFRWLALGIESESAHVRDGAGKDFTTASIFDTVRRVHDAGLHVIGNFIFGLPDDTLKSMEATLALARALDLEWANFYAAAAYPGSRLYKRAVREGWRLPARWADYSQHARGFVPCPTETLTPEEVLAFRDQAFRAYFLHPSFLDATERRFGVAARGMVERMAAPVLHRDLLGGTNGSR